MANETSSVGTGQTTETIMFEKALPDCERLIVEPFSTFTKLLYCKLIIYACFHVSNMKYVAPEVRAACALPVTASTSSSHLPVDMERPASSVHDSGSPPPARVSAKATPKCK